MCVVYVNPLMGTLKPHSNGPLYSNTVIGTLAVDGWAVTFAATNGCGPTQSSPLLVVPNLTAHPSTASVPTSHYSMWHFLPVPIEGLTDLPATWRREQQQRGERSVPFSKQRPVRTRYLLVAANVAHLSSSHAQHQLSRPGLGMHRKSKNWILFIYLGQRRRYMFLPVFVCLSVCLLSRVYLCSSGTLNAYMSFQ